MQETRFHDELTLVNQKQSETKVRDLYNILAREKVVPNERLIWIHRVYQIANAIIYNEMETYGKRRKIDF